MNPPYEGIDYSSNSGSEKNCDPETDLNAIVGVGLSEHSEGHVPTSSIPLFTNVVDVAQEVNVKGKRKRSEVWEHFDMVQLKDNKGTMLENWQCKHCRKIYRFQKSGSTSICIRHIRVCPRLIKLKNKQKFFNPEKFNKVEANDDEVGSIYGSGTYDSLKMRNILAKFIITAELSFSIVEHPYFNIYSKTLNPNHQKISRRMIKKECMNVYEVEKEKLKKILRTVERVALTCDCWTSNQSIGYLCLTVHFINSDWRLQQRIISFLDLDPPHTAGVIADSIGECIMHWNIHKKIISITLDNAKSNDGAAATLKKNFENTNRLYFRGKFFHVRCCAHVLNLIVQEGLKKIDDVISAVRDCVIYIKKTPGRLKTFGEIAKLLGVSTSRGLSSDVKTRWNSTYHMLDCAFHYRYVMHDFFRKDKGLIWTLEDYDWDRFSKIRNILEVFECATKLFSGTLYPTSNLFLPGLIEIKEVLEKGSRDDDDFVRLMCLNMKDKFDKYWSDCNLLMAIAIVLDPRRKMKFIQFVFTTIYPSNEYESRVQYVRENLFDLFSYYSVTQSRTQSGGSFVSAECSSTHVNQSYSEDRYTNDASNSVLRSFDDFLDSASATQPLKSELEIYLDENPIKLPQNHKDSFDILDWWKLSSMKMPTLSKLAKDILIVPITTVASESAFSAGGRVLNDYRSALSPKTVNALVCSSSWLNAQYKNGRESMQEIFLEEELTSPIPYETIGSSSVA